MQTNNAVNFALKVHLYTKTSCRRQLNPILPAISIVQLLQEYL